MRGWVGLLALPWLLIGLTANHKESNREEEQLVGPVRSMSSETTMRLLDLELDEPDSGRDARKQDLIAYDAKGNETERSIYDDYGFPVGKQVYKRDSGGHLLESVLSDPKGTALGRDVYVYAVGRLSETVHYDGRGKVELREANSYGEDGRLRETAYSVDNKTVGKTVYRHDSAGRRSETIYLLPDGSKAIAPIGPCLNAHRVTFTYDEKGRPRAAVSYEPSGAMKKSWLYAYDDKGQISEEKLEDSYGRTTRTHAYEYDSKGNWIKRTTTSIELPNPDRMSARDRKLFPGLMEPRKVRTTITRSIAYY
ncbi:MAG TPA: hypothetical protein VF548_16160 [Allosphingosinicella sp.]